MKLMIIESPGKVEKLTAILGADWQVIASAGHIRDLPKNEMGVAAPDFKPNYVFSPGQPDPRNPGRTFPGGEDRCDRIAKLVKKANEIYLATDPDREGESISWHLKEALGLKEYARVTFNEVTPAAVNKSLLAARTIDVKLVAAQEARRILDRFVGYLVSPVLSNITSQSLSAGRVQSVAVRLVVDREREIQAFKPTAHFGAELKFESAAGEWVVEWVTKPDFTSDDSPYFMDRAFAQRVADAGALSVISCIESEKKRNPPAPFTTVALQQAASIALRLDPKKTMSIAQALFDNGHITYHRTDNPNVSAEAMEFIAAEAAKLQIDMAPKQRMFEAKEGAQAGHPAITPTHWDVKEAGETEDERNLYKLIRIRAIASQLVEARFAVRSVVLEAAALDGKSISFAGKGEALLSAGWLTLLQGDQTDEDEETTAKNPIPRLQAGSVVTPITGRLLEKKTRALGRFTLASLVGRLEKESIGRPATYAAIMDNIIGKNFIVAEGQKRQLRPTEAGELVVDSLVGRFSFMELGFTRELENDLDKIASGQAGYKQVIANAYGLLQRELINLEASAPAPKFPCPDCGKGLRRIKGAKNFFWGCSGHPDCKTSLPDADGKPGRISPKGVSNFHCPKCNRPLIHQVKDGSKGFNFWGCSGYKMGCKAHYLDKDNAPIFGEKK